MEERIGNVSTGLSEETIVNNLKQQKYSVAVGAKVEAEPCCICQVMICPLDWCLVSPEALLCFTNYFLPCRRNTMMEKILEHWTADMISTRGVLSSG